MINQMKQYNFSKNNKYRIEFTAIGDKGLWFDNDEFNDMCTNIQLPDITEAPIEEYFNSKWYQSRGRNEIYMVTFQMRDYDYNTLYKEVLTTFEECKNLYPADQKFNVDIYTADTGSDYTKLLKIEDCIISSISGLTLDASSDQLQEWSFTVKGTILSQD